MSQRPDENYRTRPQMRFADTYPNGIRPTLQITR
jgi:hypothetical protein